MKGNIIAGEIYSVKQSDDLYLNMLKVTPLNAEKWRDFADKQNNYINNNPDALKGQSKAIYDANYQIINNVDVGGRDFRTCTNYYNNKDTEVWVACASYKPIEDPNEVDSDNIEMAFTVTTSVNAPFTTHMGIFRSVSALFAGKPKHTGLANFLHAFAAQVMLTRYPEKEHAMSVPMLAMREILINEFIQKGFSNFICALTWNNSEMKEEVLHLLTDTIPDCEQKSLNDIYEHICVNGLYISIRKAIEEYKVEVKADYDEVMKLPTDRAGYAVKYGHICLFINLLDQYYTRYNQTSSYEPVTVAFKTGLDNPLKYRAVSTLTVHSSSGKVCNLVSENYPEEYNWFFGNTHLFKGIRSSSPLIIMNLRQLSQLKGIMPEAKLTVVSSTEDEMKAQLEQEKLRVANAANDKELKKQQVLAAHVSKSEQERIEQERLAQEKAERQRLEQEAEESARRQKQLVEQQRKLLKQLKSEVEELKQELGEDEEANRIALFRRQSERSALGAVIGLLTGCAALYTLHAATSWPEGAARFICLVVCPTLVGGALGYLSAPTHAPTKER